jgi:hypothetical protein
MTTVAAVPTEAEWGTATPEQRTNWRSLHPGTPHPPHIQTTAPDDEAALSARCCVDTPPWPAAEWEASLRPGGVDPPSSITRLPTAVAAVHYVGPCAPTSVFTTFTTRYGKRYGKERGGDCRCKETRGEIAGYRTACRSWAMRRFLGEDEGEFRPAVLPGGCCRPGGALGYPIGRPEIDTVLAMRLFGGGEACVKRQKLTVGGIGTSNWQGWDMPRLPGTARRGLS